jgi:hypothetical protein
MLTPDSRLRPNHNEVAAKVMDGEAILINISNGMYHSMENVGGAAWELIAEGHALKEVIQVIADHYDASYAQVETDVMALANALMGEQLVVESTDSVAAPTFDTPDAKLPYETPTLNTYKDMNDLLALDPPMPGLQEIPWEESA